MVPTTSLAQDLNFTINDLIRAQTPEDTELVADVRRTIDALVARLKPVLHYIAKPMSKGSHAVNVAQMGSDNYFLGISRDGVFGLIKRESGEFEQRPDAADCVTVQDVIDGLHAALKEAEQKREQHLAAVTKRRELMGQIQQLVANTAMA